MAKQLSSRLKWILIGIFGLLAVIAYFSLTKEVSSAQFVPLPTSDSFGDLPDPQGEGLQKGYNVVFELARNFRVIIAAVAILFMVISGVKLVIQGEQEEVATKQKTNLYWGIVGLGMIMIAGPISEILDLQDGGFLSDEYEIASRAKLFDRQVNIIIVFIKYIVGSIAVLFMIRSGAKLVMAGDSEEVLTTERKNLMTSGFALFIIMLADTVVKQVLFKVETPDSQFTPGGQEAVVTFDVGRGVEEIVGITNFVVTWAAPFAVLALIVGAVMYLTAFGDEEKTGKAKKILMNSIIALMIIYGAFAIVSTLVSGVF
jgi:hypothetical protein